MKPWYVLQFLLAHALTGSNRIRPLCLSGCAEESLYVSDPSRSNPAARTFTRQRDVERVLAMIDESALVRRRRGREEGEEDEEQG